MMGFVVVPFQTYVGVDKSEQFKHEFGPKLGGATNEFWYSNMFVLAVKWLLHIFTTIINQESV